MTRKVRIRRYSVLRTANVTLLGYLFFAILLTLVATAWSVSSGEAFEVLLGMGIQIPFWSAGVWVTSALVVLTYNLLLARFRCLRIEIEVEDEEEKTEPEN